MDNIKEFIKKQICREIEKTDFKCPRDLSNLMTTMSSEIIPILFASFDLDYTKEKDIKLMHQIALAESDKIHNNIVDFIDFMRD